MVMAQIHQHILHQLFGVMRLVTLVYEDAHLVSVFVSPRHSPPLEQLPVIG